MTHAARPLVRVALPVSAWLMALMAGCAVLKPAGTAPAAETAAAAPVSAPSGAASAPRAPGAAPVAVAPSGPLRPFAEIVRDARRIDGLFTLWQKDDKVWLELTPDDLKQSYFLSPKYKTGIGEPRFYGGLLAEESVVEFRRVHNLMQLLSRNTDYLARAGTPTARAVDVAFSASLLAAAPVLSLPHPERKSVLVEANALFINDMLAIGLQLQRQYRQGYTLDLRNSAITSVRASPELLVLEVLNHYATGSIAFPAPGMPPGAPVPSVPRSLPDPRSLFMTLHYSLARLPALPMPVRKSDARVGTFTTSHVDFSDDLERNPRQRYVNRWRLEKKDAQATLSEPVHPITFWIDRTVPEKYRAPITAGVLEWNKAFEQIGYKNALRVEVQPDNADFDTLDFGRASIRWLTHVNTSFGAIGLSHVDPRSGEILAADIAIESLSSRAVRSQRSQVLAPQLEGSAATEPELTGLRGRALASCDYADQAAEQLAYALDVFEARGDIEPGSPESEHFVAAYVKDVTMHEVGHALGLRHNFRASRVYTDQQLSDPAFTAVHALGGSVMEYSPINLPAPGVPSTAQGSPFSTTLGSYDYWAIEYAYRPLPADREAAELARIAGRSAEPELAYGTDEDNSLGIDPETLQLDLGADPLAFARKRVAIARDLLARQETRQLGPDEDYSVLRRSVGYALRDMGRAAAVLARQIGGVRTLRDHAGSGRDPLAPVPAAQQREALDLLSSAFLSVRSLRVSPALQRRLALDYQERSDAVFRGDALGSTDFAIDPQVLNVQRLVLSQLMSDAVASRLLDSEAKLPKDALQLSELYQRLDTAVWSELVTHDDIGPLRRELQRDYVNRIAVQLLRPGSLTRADARSLARRQAQSLLGRLNAASQRGGLSVEARAHLQDSADTLTQALNARLLRAGT